MTTNCVTYPEVPAVPGVPPTITLQSIRAWDAGAIGGEDTDGNVELVFSGVLQCVGAVIGLTVNEDVTTPAQMSHAFYFHTGVNGSRLVSAMESGIARADLGSYNLTTEFKLQRIDGAVLLLIDGAVCYTFHTTSAGPVHVGCSLYATDDSLPSDAPVAPPAPTGPMYELLFDLSTFGKYSYEGGVQVLAVPLADVQTYLPSLSIAFNSDMTQVEIGQPTPVDGQLGISQVKLHFVGSEAGAVTVSDSQTHHIEKDPDDPYASQSLYYGASYDGEKVTTFPTTPNVAQGNIFSSDFFLSDALPYFLMATNGSSSIITSLQISLSGVTFDSDGGQ